MSTEPAAGHLEQAEGLLWQALKEGKVHAQGLPHGEADAADIPSVQWLNLEWMPNQSKMSVRNEWVPNWPKMSVRNFAHPEPRYRVVTVSSREVLALWPDLECMHSLPKQASLKSQAVTNKGGRVMASHWHDMWAEVCRIIYDEGVPPIRLDLVKRMQQWFTDRDLEAPENQVLNPIFDRLFEALKR